MIGRFSKSLKDEHLSNTILNFEEQSLGALFEQQRLLFLQKMDDELFPSKDGAMLTSDIDYVDVWRVRTHVVCLVLQCLFTERIYDIKLNIIINCE